MEFSTLVLTIVGGVFLIYYLFFRKLGYFEKLGILHVKPLPVFGNMASTLFRQYTFVEALDKVYRLREDAKYVGFYDFAEPVFLVRSPELIKDISIKHFDHFVDHRGFVDAEQDPLFGNNLFSLRGDKWKNMRTILSPAFTGSKMRAMFKLMSNCGENFAQYFVDQSVHKPVVVNSKDAFTRYTNDVIATCAFGINIDSMRNPKNDFYVLGRKATNFEGILSIKFFALRSFPRIAKLFNIKLIDRRIENFFEDVVRQTVEMRESKGISRPDMIQLMMESRKNKSNGMPELSMLDMTSQAFIFFFGGFDTSSSLMCFVAHEIAAQPMMHRRLQDEIDEVLEETKGEITYDAINKMEYLDAIINESLRYYPIAGFLDRLCVKPYDLPPAYPGAKPVTVQPGQNVWFPVYSLQRDSKYFRDPNTFDPDRFIGAAKKDIDPSIYIPFGQGPRMCIGNRFALLETKVMIFHLLAKCNIQPAPKMILPLELSKSSFAMTAKGGFWLQIEPRKGNS